MIEKIQIGKCLSELPDGNADKIVGLSGANGTLTTSSSIVNEGGCGCINPKSLNNGKWYRIAIGNSGSDVSSAMINIGKGYTNNPSSAQLFYVFADGYSDNQAINNIVSTAKSIGKARILYKGSTTERVMLDIFVSAPLHNNFFLSYSCNIGFTFQSPVEVSETVDAGYSVKEFTF